MVGLTASWSDRDSDYRTSMATRWLMRNDPGDEPAVGWRYVADWANSWPVPMQMSGMKWGVDGWSGMNQSGVMSRSQPVEMDSGSGNC